MDVGTCVDGCGWVRVYVCMGVGGWEGLIVWVVFEPMKVRK